MNKNLDYYKPFFDSKAFGVVGASANREKYGNKVLRCYLQNGYEVYPVNPREETIEGISSYPSVSSLPPDVKSLSIITPPKISETIVEQAISKGIQSLWFQPGSMSELAVKTAIEAGLHVIYQGECILVSLGYKDN